MAKAPTIQERMAALDAHDQQRAALLNEIEQTQLPAIQKAQAAITALAKPEALEALLALADDLTDNRQHMLRSIVGQITQGATFFAQEAERIERAGQPQGEAA